VTVLSLDEAKSHLNMTSTVDDAELSAVVDAAEAAIAKRVGPLEPTDVTSIINCGGWALTLPQRPVISITSVVATVPFGTVTVPTDLVVDGESGVVTSQMWAIPAARYTVTYVAGRDDLPADLLFAVKEMVRHLWRSQRGSASLPGQGGGDTATPGYLIPNAVAELLQPHKIYGFGLV
jgi:hypothetical protein